MSVSILIIVGCNDSETTRSESGFTIDSSQQQILEEDIIHSDSIIPLSDLLHNQSVERRQIKSSTSVSRLNISYKSNFERIKQRIFELKQEEYKIDPNELRRLIKKKHSDDISMEIVSELSPSQFFSLFTENDIMVSGDQYYTNGSRIAWVSPFVAHSPISGMLIPYPWHARNYYGISIVQNMYTPSHPDDDKPRPGDRPFAGYMYISHFKQSIDPIHKLKLYSSLDIGVIGPASFGGRFQRAFHQKEPKDWIIQIENDVIVNYNIQLEKSLFSSRFFQFDLMGALQAGTVYDNASAGAQIIFGRINPFMHSFIKDDYNNHKFDLFFILNYRYQHNWYDATLQGGLINKTSPYVLNEDLVIKNVKRGSATMNLRYGHSGMEFGFYYIGPEFVNAQSHRWWRLCLTFGF